MLHIPIVFSISKRMRKDQIISGEYYHVFNRGNNKQPIFLDESDRIRFLFLILYFQSNANLENISRFVQYFVKHRVFNISEKKKDFMLENKSAELINFAFMPNHFHMTIREVKDGGLSRYMQRALNGYTKYFNAKYKRSGHLFQGPFKAVRVTSNEQLLHLSAYIHRNPREIKEWRYKEDVFPWSSYQDYVYENRWGEFLRPSIIIEQISFGKEYKNFVETSGTKKLEEELDDNFKID